MADKIKNYAFDKHNSVNQLYDVHSYSVHLTMVRNVGVKFIHLIPEEAQDDVLNACLCHDLIEDTHETYNNVKDNTNERIADLVYALTNEKGKTRKERANDKYYNGIKELKYATFIKLADRIANVEYSKITGGKMYSMYKKELNSFVQSLITIDTEYNEMFNYLISLFEE